LLEILTSMTKARFHNQNVPLVSILITTYPKVKKFAVLFLLVQYYVYADS